MQYSFEPSTYRLHLLDHPFYQAWMKGEVPWENLRHYAAQYSFHVDRFPRYLSAIHSNCEDSRQRKTILENLNDEEGTHYGISHPELWLQFCEGLGVSREAVATSQAEPAIQNVAATFFKFARRSYHEGLAALYAYESQVPEVAHSKIEGLKARYGVTDERTLAFFTVHERADVAHRQVLKEMLVELPEGKRETAACAAREAAQSLWDFLTAVHTRPAYA